LQQKSGEVKLALRAEKGRLPRNKNNSSSSTITFVWLESRKKKRKKKCKPSLPKKTSKSEKPRIGTPEGVTRLWKQPKRNSEPYLKAFFVLRVEDEHTVFFHKGVLQDVPFLRSHLSIVVGHPSLGFFH